MTQHPKFQLQQSIPLEHQIFNSTFFTQGFYSWNGNVFFVCAIIMVLASSFFSISKTINLYLFLFPMLLNKLIIDLLFFFYFISFHEIMLLFILSKLLKFPMSGIGGLISIHVILFENVSLWSFIVMQSSLVTNIFDVIFRLCSVGIRYLFKSYGFYH